ncbi:AEC family transporter [Fodinicurvata sediminis]|uniref:AEC family transporter n=1 Tax=Fodinicurvata sediminis TaxID=1121832 RepID=UPI0003B3ECC7|nr:AEC family transporter [Fodinicurvata sediminis]
MLAPLISVIAPILVCVALGYVWGRKGWSFDNAQITALVMYIGTPCLLVRTFDQTRPDPEAFGEIALATILVTLLVAFGAAVILKLARLDLRDYLPGLIFPNTGNLGLPFILFAFGDAGLALAIVYFTVNVIGHFTLGMTVARGSLAWRELLRLPVIYAVGVGLALIIWDLQLPKWISNTVDLLGGMTIPLMLLTLGVSLSNLPLQGVKRGLSLSALRLGGGLTAALLVSHLLGLAELERNVLVLQSSMPVAVYSYLFAERFGRSAEDVAGMVVFSTVMSFAFLPALLWALTR